MANYKIRCIILKLAEGPSLASEKKNLKKIRFFKPITSLPPMSVHKKFQPNRSSRLMG